MILGIDEVGRGPWAGPLVMGAVILGDAVIDGLTDSKKLSRKRRSVLDVEIRTQSAAYGLGWVTAEELDNVGMSQALVLACRRAVEAVDTLGVAYDEIIIDGTINFLKNTNKGSYVTTMKKADLLIQAVSAASIVAKVARDNYMIKQAELYPGYGFENHVGYGTAAHSAAIEKLGVTPLHRLSFAPLHRYVVDTNTQLATKEATNGTVTTRQIGDASENIAARELERRGHTILARNWKNRFCEIDIVSSKDGILYFTEVKHRRDDVGGGGLAAITPRKLHQMKFASDIYVHSYGADGAARQLVAISTSGDNPRVDDVIFIE